MIAVARRAEAGIKQLLAEEVVPHTVFVRRRMRKPIGIAFGRGCGNALAREEDALT